MNTECSLNILAENIFIDKIKNKYIPSHTIHSYWKSSREEAKNIITTKEIIKNAPHCIIINNIINFIMNIISNIIIKIIILMLIYILLYICCFIYILYYK